MREAGRTSTRHPHLEDWPPLHRQAWLRAFEEGGLFEPSGAATKWRPATAKKTCSGYGAFLHWRQSHGDMDAAKILASRPEDLVSREAVLAYVEHLASLHSSMTSYNRAQELHDAVRAMAPECDWAWLKTAQRNLRSRARPENDKLARLRPADRLEELGFSLMAEAETAPYFAGE